MDNVEILDAVTREYLKNYSWSKIEITEYIPCYAGFFLVVEGYEKGKCVDTEICFCSHDLKVSIFSTTEELLRELNRRLKPRWSELLFTKVGLSFLVIMLSLVTLCILVFIPTKPNDQIIQLIGGALIAAIGFLFGSSR